MILHFCATSTDVIKNFAVIKSVITKRVHCNSKVNSPIMLEFKHVRDFMPVQVICNFHTDPIKTKQAMRPDKVEYGGFWH